MEKIKFAVIILLITVGGIAMYQKLGWENRPSTKTSMSAENFGHMDEGIHQAHLESASNTNQINGLEINKVDKEDIEAVNARIDGIVVTPAEGVSAQEIIDARQGAGSLGANLSGIKSRVEIADNNSSLSIPNLVGDQGKGDNVSGWARKDGIVSSGGYFVASTSGVVRGGISFDVIGGHKYLVSVIAQSTDTSGRNLRLRLVNNPTIDSPISASEYLVITADSTAESRHASILTATGNGGGIAIGRDTSSGSNVGTYKVKYLHVVDLTAVLDMGGFSDHDALNEYISSWDQGWFGTLQRIPWYELINKRVDFLEEQDPVIPVNDVQGYPMYDYKDNPLKVVPHNPYKLKLDTYQGTGSATHPSVLYVPDGFGLKGWKFIMAITPMPTIHENPSIFVGYDGLRWEVPEGIPEPLVSKPPHQDDFNSDPNLLYHDGMFYLYYREVLRSQNPVTANIKLLTSTNGVTWTSPVLALSGTPESVFLSPSVIHNGENFIMFYVDWVGNSVIKKRTSTDGINWSEETVCSYSGLSGRYPWHFGVLRGDGRLEATISTTPFSGGTVDMQGHYAYSVDEGLTWTVNPEPYLTPYYDFEGAGTIDRIYTTGFIKTPGYDNVYQSWYSGRNDNGYWTTLYLPLIRDGDQLYPVTNSTIIDNLYANKITTP